MSDPTPTVQARVPTPEAFVRLRRSMGWPAASAEVAQCALDGSWWVGTVHDPAGKLLALIRVTGDGALSFTIADLMVDPKVRGHGLGDRLMAAALEQIGPAAAHGATVAVVPIAGKESFYARHGFVCTAPFGQAMVWAPPLAGLLNA